MDDVGGITAIRATLETWRTSGADRVNPARFRFIDALERRAANYDGGARRLLDERLGQLIADYSGEILRAQMQAKAEAAANANGAVRNVDLSRNTPAAASTIPTETAPCRSPLGELVDLLTSRSTPAGMQSEPQIAHNDNAPHAHRRDGSSDLPILDYFRETWSRVSVDKQLRQSLEQVPDNAGPLNSNGLVHRSLALMRELSPGYLHQFLSYLEALSWMEELAGPVAGTGVAAAPAAEIASPSGAKKRARAKSR
jgi:hypothetical protein